MPSLTPRDIVAPCGHPQCCVAGSCGSNMAGLPIDSGTPRWSYEAALAVPWSCGSESVVQQSLLGNARDGGAGAIGMLPLPRALIDLIYAAAAILTTNGGVPAYAPQGGINF